MLKEFQRLSGDNPVRFVITTGDNVYGQIGLTLRFSNTGDKDTHWDAKFFRPYERLIGRIPFYPSLGNHDGNETESRGDLMAYLDNFFFPGHTASRYYRFSFGGLVDFFALDSTTNSESGPPRPAYRKDSEQHKWLQTNMAESRVPWKIPYFHHPPYSSAGRHGSDPRIRATLEPIFVANKVSVVFTGHDHVYERIKPQQGITYFVTGSGGQLRQGDLPRGSPITAKGFDTDATL